MPLIMGDSNISTSFDVNSWQVALKELLARVNIWICSYIFAITNGGN